MTAKLFSKLDYPVEIVYGNSYIQVPPYAFGITVDNEKALGEIPEGIKVMIVKGGK